MRVLNEYPGSHHYFDEFSKESCFCLNCGKKDCVWSEDQGDYYVGGDWVCTECGAKWYCPMGIAFYNEKRELHIIEQLKSGITNKPKTPRGN